jgi:hypothetical protein
MAESIFVLGEGGGIFEMSLPLPEAIEDRLAKGYLRRVNQDGTPYSDGVPPVRPASSSAKVEWVGWAVHHGMTPDDADALTKADLIEKFGKPVSADLGSDEAKQVADKFFEQPSAR